MAGEDGRHTVFTWCMRPIWKGAITFGLVNVPVKVYSATESHDVPLHQVHDKDGGRIRYERHCEIDGELVPYEHIARAYDDGERTVILTDDDFAALPAERSREIDVVEFVPDDQIEPVRLDKAYFLEPDSKSVKSYALLRRTLEQEKRTAIVQFALRQRTRLGVLRVHDDVLMVQTLLWDDEVRQADFPSLDEDVRISENELKMARSLVESFAADFDPSRYDDEYQVQLRQLVAAKLEQGDALDTAATFGEQKSDEVEGEVIDLMEALKRSLERNKAAAKPASKPGAAAKAVPAAKSGRRSKTDAKSTAATSRTKRAKAG